MRVVPCSRCHQRLATRQITDLSGQVTWLCDACAQESTGMQLVPYTVLMPILGPPLMPELLECPNCGTSLQSLQQSSHLGCSHCYLHFREPILATVRRLHGSAFHSGQRPRRSQEALPPATMRARLETAIREERYEDAAILRDQLRSAEGP